jgi:hypothetical protein
MKPVTINLSEPVYRAFQEYARRHDRTTSELVREAMAVYLETRMRPERSLSDLPPLELGKVRKPLTSTENLLDEMMADERD